MGSASQNRVLDFGPIGMWWEITKSTADTGGELFEAVNVLAPSFAGPPLHTHPTAEESYGGVRDAGCLRRQPVAEAGPG